MENQFYTRPTGKFKSVHPSSYGSKDYPKKDQESVYSLESYEDDYSQHPMGELSPTQMRFIKDFLRAILSAEDVEIDPFSRSIHWVATWRQKENDLTISCSTIQPHITACTMGLSGMTHSTAEIFAKRFFSKGETGFPSLLKVTKFCQALGKYSIPFSDVLLERKLIKQEKVQYSNVVMSKMQLMFCVIQSETAYECKMTHASCRIIADSDLGFANISHPTTTSHNFAFRSPRLRAGSGTGPSITVHTSGSMQYNGSPSAISEVTKCFRQCLCGIMESKNSMKFLRSLCIVRELAVP